MALLAGLAQLDPQVQAWQQFTLGVGHLGAQGDLACGGVHGQVGKQELARVLVLSSIAQDQAHARCVFALRALELAAGHGFGQLKNVVCRLSEVDVDRVGCWMTARGVASP